MKFSEMSKEFKDIYNKHIESKTELVGDISNVETILYDINKDITKGIKDNLLMIPKDIHEYKTSGEVKLKFGIKDRDIFDNVLTRRDIVIQLEKEKEVKNIRKILKGKLKSLENNIEQNNSKIDPWVVNKSQIIAEEEFLDSKTRKKQLTQLLPDINTNAKLKSNNFNSNADDSTRRVSQSNSMVNLFELSKQNKRLSYINIANAFLKQAKNHKQIIKDQQSEFVNKYNNRIKHLEIRESTIKNSISNQYKKELINRSDVYSY